MKRLILLLFFIFGPLLATLKYDFVEHKYYTVPEDVKVDQELYNLYMCICNIYVLELVNAEVPADIRDDYIELYLTNLNNYTAQRLLEDLIKANQESTMISPKIVSKQFNRDV